MSLTEFIQVSSIKCAQDYFTKEIISYILMIIYEVYAIFFVPYKKVMQLLFEGFKI